MAPTSVEGRSSSTRQGRANQGTRQPATLRHEGWSRRGGGAEKPARFRALPGTFSSADAIGRRAGIDPLSIAEIARAAAEDKKAQDVLVLDVRDLTIIADYFVIASGTSRTQVKAITDAVTHELKERGVLPLHREGTVEGGWIILDYADTVVHVFHARQREYYDLERLYRSARVVEVRTGESAREVYTEPREAQREARGS
ncbi:MAG: ribosome silencing factor [Firmicutes bacterium]|nr:ribosome silencing factor [Bacillota bacterium]